MEPRLGSRKVQILGTLVIVGLVAAVATLAQAKQQDTRNAALHLRNEGSQSVRILIGYGPGRMWEDWTVTVPPWSPGMCPTALLDPGLDHPASVSLETTGPYVENYLDPVPVPTAAPLYIRVDSAGSVHFGEAIPPEPQDCVPYRVH